MKSRVQLESGEVIECFIPFMDKLKYFFSFNRIPVNKVVWRKVGTKKIYRYDWKNRELVLIKDAFEINHEEKRK